MFDYIPFTLHYTQRRRPTRSFNKRLPMIIKQNRLRKNRTSRSYYKIVKRTRPNRNCQTFYQRNVLFHNFIIIKVIILLQYIIYITIYIPYINLTKTIQIGQIVCKNINPLQHLHYNIWNALIFQQYRKEQHRIITYEGTKYQSLKVILFILLASY